MAASIALKDASAARGAPDFASGSNWKPGRTVCMYVDGNFVAALPTGPFGTLGYGNVGQQAFMPSAPETTGAKPVVAKDNTDITISATTTVTLT